MPAVLEPLTMKPKPGEKQVDFYLRASKQLKRRYSRRDQRTAAAFDLWVRGGGENSLQQMAREKFPSDQFTLVRSRPIFAEHITQDSKGQPERYDRAALQAVADRCNERILDTGDFPPLTDGHTPTAEMSERGAKHPDVLGYAGPFRVGLIGNRSPRWAIFCDEYHHKDEYSRLRKLQRRSPEVWREPRMADRIMDPIACLGAETPRLDLGMTSRFCRNSSGVLVEKYTAACFPAGGNTSVPAPVGKAPSKRRYAAGVPPMDQPQPPDNSGVANGINPELIKAIVGALMETAPMQWVIQQQQASETNDNANPESDLAEAGDGDGDEMPPGEELPPPETDADADVGDAPDAGDEFSGDDMAGDDVGPPDESMDESPEVSADSSPDMPPPDEAPEIPEAPEAAGDDVGPDDESDMDEEEAQHYAALPAAYRPHYLRGRRSWKKRYEAGMGGGGPSMYSRGRASGDPLSAEVDRLSRTLAEVKKQNAALTRTNRYSARHSQLEKLAKDYAFELKAEYAETRDYSPAQWEQHVARIKSRYSRKANAMDVPQLPTPDLDQPQSARSGEPDKYGRRAREILDRVHSVKGEPPITWDEARARAKKELG